MMSIPISMDAGDMSHPFACGTATSRTTGMSSKGQIMSTARLTGIEPNRGWRRSGMIWMAEETVRIVNEQLTAV